MRWWKTGKPGVLQSIRLQRAGHNWVNEQQRRYTMTNNTWKNTRTSLIISESWKLQWYTTSRTLGWLLSEKQCWHEHKDMRTLVHCWWECETEQLLWETVWWFLKTLNIALPYDPEIQLLGIHSKELKAVHHYELAIGICMSPSSWTSLPAPTPSHPSRLLQSPCLSSLSHTANFHWLSILHMVVYMLPCFFLHLSHPFHVPHGHSSVLSASHWKWKWKSLSHVSLFATPWTIQSMEFSRPEYWSG